jgi:UDP-N-acetylmuramate: L-alanyl-gamma-D-glutamyl-meso-diaminopimelate ligase
MEYAGLKPGFLIGGVPDNFGTSARLGSEPFFVIEADEYDTAFFDKRAKFVHYRPRTLVLNNLEYDHADIYPDLASIERQFHHLVRIVPGSGLIVVNSQDANLARVLAQGCWSQREFFGHAGSQGVGARLLAEDGSEFVVTDGGRDLGRVRWSMLGLHNVDNALAAILASRHAGVPVAQACEALAGFRGIKRRMELRGVAAGVTVYDDFAHHPTAIATTVGGLRRRIGQQARLIAVLEPRSATMRLGVHRDTLAASLAEADAVWLMAPANLGWDITPVTKALGARGQVAADSEALLAGLLTALRAGDQVVIMSNGGFGGLHDKLLAALKTREG